MTKANKCHLNKNEKSAAVEVLSNYVMGEDTSPIKSKLEASKRVIEKIERCDEL